MARRVAPFARSDCARGNARARAGADASAIATRLRAAVSTARGLPSRTPLAFAAARAATVRALIWSRSCSAKAASMCTISLLA